MINSGTENDYLKISAFGYNPFLVRITDGKLETIEPHDIYSRKLIKLDNSRCFIFHLDYDNNNSNNKAEIIASIQEKQIQCTVEFSAELERLIVYNFTHFASLVFFTCYYSNGNLNQLFLVKTALEVDGDIAQQIHRDCFNNETYQKVLSCHFWLIKKTMNVFTEKIENLVKFFNILLFGLGTLGFVFSEKLNLNTLALLLTILIVLILIKKEQEFNLFSHFKNSSRLSKDKPVNEKKFSWHFLSINSLVAEIATEMGDRQLSQSIFIVGFIVPRLAINQDIKDLNLLKDSLTLLVPIFIFVIVNAKDWIKNQRFFIQFKQQLEKSNLYLQILKFLTKFETTAFLFEIAIAAFLLGRLVKIDRVSHWVEMLNSWTHFLTPENTLKAIALLGVILIGVNLLNVQNLNLQYRWQNQGRKLPDIIIPKIFGYIILLITIIGEGFLLGYRLSGFSNSLPLTVIQVILLTFIIMRLPHHLMIILRKFFWHNIISNIVRD